MSKRDESFAALIKRVMEKCNSCQYSKECIDIMRNDCSFRVLEEMKKDSIMRILMGYVM